MWIPFVYVEYNEQCQQGDPWPDTIIMQMLKNHNNEMVSYLVKL